MNEVGLDVALRDRKYKALREAWVASCYLLAAANATGVAWWVKPNGEDTAPDCHAFAMEQKDGSWEGQNVAIEVFEWHEATTLDLAATVRNKLENLAANNFVVVGYLRKPYKDVDFDEIAAMLKSLQPRVSEVILLIPRDGKYVILKVFPEMGWLPVPNALPKAYEGIPYEFASKKRTLGGDENGWAGEGGLYSIDSFLNFKRISD